MLRDVFDDGLPPRPVPAPWTASRCNRTLRKLTTFVAKIEKWHQAFLVASEAEADQDEDEIEASNQPGWLTQDTSKKGQKSRKMYTTRRKMVPRTPAPKGLRKSRSAGTTPQNNNLHRLADIHCDAERSNIHRNTKTVLVENITRPPLVSRSWTAATAHLADGYETILRDGWIVIPAFLVATSDPAYPSSFDLCLDNIPIQQGARSLTDMCLASLSRDIVKKQRENDTSRAGYDGQQDIIGSQFNELEDYFGDSRNGWRPLRNVVRICGISMVTRLIRNGALTEETAIDLAIRWHHRPFLDDFSDAIQKVLVDSGLEPEASDNGYSYLPGNGDLEAWTGRFQDAWKAQLTQRWTLRALRTSEDPIALMASGIRFNHLVLSVNFSRSTKASECSGHGLLEAVFQAALACGQSHTCEDLRRIPSSTSFAVRGQQGVAERTDLDQRLWQRLKMTLYLVLSFSEDDSCALPELIVSLSKHAQVLVELGLDYRQSALQQTLTAQIFLVHLCHLLSRDRNIPRDLMRSFEMLLCSIEARNTLHGQLAGTIIACFGQDLEMIQRIVDKILSIDCHDFEMLHTLLMQIVSEGAMEYAAEDSPTPATLSWAMGIHEKARERLGSLVGHGDDSGTAKLTTGYRWDDGLEEWIAKTPAAARIADGTRSKLTTYVPRHGRAASASEYLRKDTEQCPKADDRPSPTVIRGRTNGNATMRKRLASEFEVFADGDFEYKKPRRKTLPEQGCLPSCAGTPPFSSGKRDRENQKAEDISGDELGLLD